MFKQHKVSIKKISSHGTDCEIKTLKKRTPLHKGSTLFYLFLGVNRFRYWRGVISFALVKIREIFFVVSEA